VTRPLPIILSSPSGGGKTTIAKRLLAQRPDVGYSVSCTTRQPREGEVEGRDYYFLSQGEFESRRDRGEFAEWAEVHGRLYGTLRREVKRVLDSGRHVLMDIDVQGAMQFHAAFPEAVLIFVLPPSADVLLARLKARRTESREALAVRLRSALAELRALGSYEYVVVNGDLELAVAQVAAVIDAEVLRRERVDGLEAQVAGLVQQLEREIEGVSHA
jgi:guanylate kinase